MRDLRRWICGTLPLVMMLLSLHTASARERFSLNEGWTFLFAHEIDGGEARLINLPHTWNEDALAGLSPYQQTRALYQRDLYLPTEWEQQRLFLCFQGVESEAELFINGAWVDSHRGGGVAFTWEITPHVIFGSNNQLVITVSNAPRGDRMPISSERNCYGGITREVELLVTDPTTISPLHLGTEGLLIHPTLVREDQVEGYAELHLLVPSPKSLTVTLKAHNPQGEECLSLRRTLKSTYDFRKGVQIPFALENPQRWSPQNPALYRFTAIIEGEGVADAVSVETGFRHLSLSAEEGFRLNGQPIHIQGVSLAYDHPHCASLLGPEQFDRELALVRELGANTLLSPAAPHAQYLYEQCDREGLLARIDLPFSRTPFLSDIFYSASPAFESHGEELLRMIIAQNLHHPSVVMWGLFHDLRLSDPRLVEYLRHLQSVAHTADPSRPTVATSNQDGEMNFLTDGIIWHQQVGWLRGQLSDITVWLEQMGRNWSHLKSAIHYGFPGFYEQQPDRYERPTPLCRDLPERRQSRYHEEYARQLEADTLLWGEWIEGLSDYGAARREGGRAGTGLVDFSRQVRKDAFYLHKARWNRQEPTLHIADKRWRNRPAEPQTLTVYCSEACDSLLMLINEDSLWMKPYAPHIYRREGVLLKEENRLEVRLGELSDRAEIRCGSALTPPVPRAPLQTIGLSRIN